MYESVKEDILIVGAKEADELRFEEVEREYKDAIKNKKNTFLYTIDNVALIYAGIKNNVFRIFCIYVLPRYRNNGYGQLLLDAVTDIWRKRFYNLYYELDVRVNNVKAIKFYTRNNFYIVKRVGKSYVMRYKNEN